MDETIYNHRGIPVLQILDDGRLVSFSGKSVGFISGDNVYDYNGIHRGWFREGLLRDHQGRVSGFTDNASGLSPLLPLTSLPPLPALTELEPLRPLESLPPLPPLDSMSWSPIDPIQMFRI